MKTVWEIISIICLFLAGVGVLVGIFSQLGAVAFCSLAAIIAAIFAVAESKS